jgi:hypothetical protein
MALRWLEILFKEKLAFGQLQSVTQTALWLGAIYNRTMGDRLGDTQMDNQFSDIRKAFGVAPDTSTIKGIVSYTSLWLEKSESASVSGLVNGCTQMSATLYSAIVATEAELKETGETDETLADPTMRCLEAYERLREVVQDMAKAARKEDRPVVKELLDELKEAADYLAEAQDDLDAWLQEPVLRCPRCGTDEADPCQVCGLELLIPDPQGGMGVREQSVVLPQEYGQVLEAYVAVRNGEMTLSELIRRLPLIEKGVSQHLALVSATLREKSDNQTLIDTKAILENIRAGVQTIRGTRETRRMTDLQDGWLQILSNAGKLQDLRLDLLDELGGEEGQARAARERASKRQQDSFSFGSQI